MHFKHNRLSLQADFPQFYKKKQKGIFVQITNKRGKSCNYIFSSINFQCKKNIPGFHELSGLNK